MMKYDTIPNMLMQAYRAYRIPFQVNPLWFRHSKLPSSKLAGRNISKSIGSMGQTVYEYLHLLVVFKGKIWEL